MEFTGHHDKHGRKIFVGDELIHELSHKGDMRGIVYKMEDGTYSFGGGFELENYDAGVIKLNKDS